MDLKLLRGDYLRLIKVDETLSILFLIWRIHPPENLKSIIISKRNFEIVRALVYLDIIIRICSESDLIATFADRDLTTFAIRNWYTSRCIKVHHL